MNKLDLKVAEEDAGRINTRGNHADPTIVLTRPDQLNILRAC